MRPLTNSVLKDWGSLTLARRKAPVRANCTFRYNFFAIFRNFFNLYGRLFLCTEFKNLKVVFFIFRMNFVSFSLDYWSVIDDFSKITVFYTFSFIFLKTLHDEICNHTQTTTLKALKNITRDRNFFRLSLKSKMTEFHQEMKK
jgi:hypothetical protein